jgi:HEAT repeat protein
MRSAREVLLLALASCQAAGENDIGAACDRLWRSAPAQWAETLPPVVLGGVPASADLARRLQSKDPAPGRQAAIAALGKLGGPTAAEVLIGLVREGGEDAVEAALALGRLQDAAAGEVLESAAADRSRSILGRTAAACALLDLGRVRSAWPLVRAVLLAGTPAGRVDAAQHGLPEQSRWAQERHLVISAIARRSGGETFGLSTDASWPRLEQGVEALRKAWDLR